MRIRAHCLALQKAGNEPSEWEDACWPDRPLDLEVPAFRAAVADGATETSFAGLWAHLLAHQWCRSGRKTGRHLLPLRRLWLAQASARPLPWYAEEKLRSGAFAALVGLEIRDTGTWTSVAIGDSCLFQVRCGRLLCAFPLEESAAFHNRPHLLASTGRAGWEARCETAGRWEPGDRFYLPTDALAQYLLGRVEGGDEPWHDLDDLDGDTWEDWVGEQRVAGRMRNDDITLMVVTVT